MTGDVSIWEHVCDNFRSEFGEEAYQNWLQRVRFDGIAGASAEIYAPTPFVRDWLQRHYASRIKDFLRQKNRQVQDINIRLDAQKAIKEQTGLDNHYANANEQTETKPLENLDPRYTFDSFVVGKSNEMAYAAAKRIADSDEVPFNPLFLHGGVGLGKTHLMHAIAWEINKRRPDKKVVYISAERFMFEFIAALRYKNTYDFKEKFRNVDILMVDDVQFIANKDTTQEEFFHTFNALVDNRCQVVISADRSPTDLEGIEERIISRLGWGLVADVHPTDYELRLGILQSKAEVASTADIPLEVLEFLASRITSNVRELEGALNRVIAYATLVGRSVTIDMTRELLQDLLRANSRTITIDQIQRTCADYYNIRLSEMLSERRARTIARPRQVAMFLCKQLTQRSLPEIGRHFGGRDHTTVIHAVRKIEELCQADGQMDDDIMRLQRMLDG